MWKWFRWFWSLSPYYNDDGSPIGNFEKLFFYFIMLFVPGFYFYTCYKSWKFKKLYNSFSGFRDFSGRVNFRSFFYNANDPIFFFVRNSNPFFFSVNCFFKSKGFGMPFSCITFCVDFHERRFYGYISTFIDICRLDFLYKRVYDYRYEVGDWFALVRDQFPFLRDNLDFGIGYSSWYVDATLVFKSFLRPGVPIYGDGLEFMYFFFEDSFNVFVWSEYILDIFLVGGSLFCS